MRVRRWRRIRCPYCGTVTSEKRVREWQRQRAVGIMAREVIDVGFRELAKRLHPDKGGCDAAFQALVAARDYLRGL
jgi:hypothetical protein